MPIGACSKMLSGPVIIYFSCFKSSALEKIYPDLVA
jgi:hypothetical protein